MQQQAVEHVVDKAIPQIREERVAVVEIFPQKQISERMCEQSEVIEVTETASQDRNLQRTVEQTLLDLVEAVKIVRQKRNSERMCEQIGVIEVPKISSQESVEVVKIIPVTMYPRSQSGNEFCSVHGWTSLACTSAGGRGPARAPRWHA